MIAEREPEMALHQLSLRPAEIGDCELLWQWRNEETTRRSSFNSSYIPCEEHRKWFENTLGRGTSKILIILNEDKGEIGQVRLDMADENSVEVNISIDAKERNKGYGSTALRFTCQYAKDVLNIAKVIAHIKEENRASINAFSKAGFIEGGTLNFKGQRAIKMIWEQQHLHTSQSPK